MTRHGPPSSPSSPEPARPDARAGIAAVWDRLPALNAAPPDGQDPGRQDPAELLPQAVAAGAAPAGIVPDAPLAARTPDQAALIRRLSQRLGEQALDCVSSATSGNRDGLVEASASVIEAILAVWKASGVEPVEIWVELHKRERLGSLLMQLNQAHSTVRRRVLKPWQVDSTKLP